MKPAKSLALPTVVAEFGNLPAAPDVVTQLLEYLERDDADPHAIARLIARDPLLAAKTLSLANSSVCGLQRRVSTIQDAITVLGQRTLATMVAAMAVSQRFPATTVAGYDRRQFWQHSAGVALCARALASRTRVNPETAFTTGLIHDIGKLVLATLFPEHFGAVLEFMRQDDSRMLDAERRILGIDHAQIGEALALEWKFTPEVARAVAGHHEPEDHPASTLTSLVHVADAVAHGLDCAGIDDDLMPRLSDFAWNRLCLDWQELKLVMAEADAQRRDADLLFA